MTLRRLDEHQLAQVGTHKRFGNITPLRILRLAFDHDLEHEAHLAEIMQRFEAGEGQYALPGAVIKPAG